MQFQEPALWASSLQTGLQGEHTSFELQVPRTPTDAPIPYSSARCIIFFLGGPGAGKGTQCTKLTAKYHNLHHLSVGDVLRAELANTNSEFSETIARNMEQGTVGPMEITVKLLTRAMDMTANKTGTEVFLIDGFPRKMDQMKLFESVVGSARLALFLDCPEEVRLSRLLTRAVKNSQERQDDNMETIQKRFDTFANTAMEVVQHLEREGRLHRVDANLQAEDVFVSVEAQLKKTVVLNES